MRGYKHWRWVLGPLIAILIAGCGGIFSPGVPSVGGNIVRVVANNDDNDGFSSHDGINDGEGGTEIQVGTTDSTRDDVVVGFLHFDLPSLPIGGTVTSARLRVFLASMQNDPFQRFLAGGIRVDHIDFGTTLEIQNGDEFYLPTPNSIVLQENIGGLTSSGSAGWKEIDVTSQVQADIAASRGRSQFGLRFLFDQTIADPNGDDCNFNDEYVLFEDAGDHQGTGHKPELILTVN